MKKKKINWKLLLLVGAVISLSNTNVSALEEDGCYLHNNNGIHISETQYNNLLNLGFTDFEIQNIGLEEFNNNKDLAGQVVSTNTKYYINTYYYDMDNELIEQSDEEVSEDEYNATEGGILPLSLFGLTTGYIETGMKKMTTTIVASGSYYRFKVTLDWKSNPSVRSYDIIGIGMQNNEVYYVGNRTFQQTYCTSSSNCSYSSTATFKNQETGIAASFQLPTGTYSTLSSYLYFDVYKIPSVLYQMSAYGDYKHAIQTTTQYEAQDFNINIGGINLFSWVIDKYDSIPTSDATWTGTW